MASKGLCRPSHPRLGRFAPRAVLTSLLLVGAAAAPLADAAPTARTAVAASDAPATIAADDLRPGMTGYGLTVVRGTKIERFQVEVIGVLKNALPKQDIILIKCAGLNLEHSGVVAGMSGSPIYVQDPKRGDLLMGALSYGFQFNKDPVAGVTPIADMLPELDRKLIKVPENQRIEPIQAAQAVASPVHLPTGAEMQPVAVPLTLSGFHPDVVEAARDQFRDMGFPLVQVATGGTASQAPSPKFEPGSAISLSLARGDMSISGVGTVTWVRGNQFIAFGHPFKGLGQVHLPVGGADVQWILSSLASSFKMAVALEDFGVLDQDRQPAVAGRTGQRAVMVPIKVVVKSLDRGDTQTWNVEVTDQPLFFPMAAAMVVGNAVRTSEPIAENVAMTMKLRFELEGGRAPIEIVEVLTGLGGMASVNEVNGIVANVAKALVFNGFERLRVARIDAWFEVADDRNIAFIEGARAPSAEVDVGQPIAIRVRLQRANAPTEMVTLTLPPLPRDLAGSTITVQVGPEKELAPEIPEPENVDDMLNYLRRQIPRNRLAAVVALPEPTLMLRGHRLVGLPIGVRETMAGHTVPTRVGVNTLRTGMDLPWTLNGGAVLKLKVRPVD